MAPQHLNDQLPNSTKERENRNARKRNKLKALKLATTPPAPTTVRLQLDRRTIITCRKESIAFWTARYPNATIIQPA
jgi:hypothetical protein